MFNKGNTRIDHQRRQVLTLGGISLLTAVAGCLGDSEPAGDGGDESIGPALEEAISSEQSFAMTGSFEERGLEIEIESRHDNGDTYWEVNQHGMQFELYVVDGESYQRMDGDCLPMAETDESEVESEPAVVDPDVVENDPESANRYPVGRETINDSDTDVFVYLVPINGDSAETGTAYVDTETGYLRRLEYDQGSLEFHSWGAVDPVELPADCQSV